MNKLKIIPGILAFCVVAYCITLAVQRNKTQSEYMAFLQTVQGTNITKIVISDDSFNRSSVLASVSSPSVLGAFALAANTVEPYRPNHPSYATGVFIEVFLSDGQKREFLCHTMPRDKMLYVDFARRSENWTSFYGNCKSAALFDWLETQTPNRGGSVGR